MKKPKMAVGIALIVIGAIMLFFSNSIAQQVATGRMQIQQGQQEVNTVNQVFGMSSYTKPVGQQLTQSGQNRINAGTAEANQYESISNMLRIGGIVLIAIGGWIVITSRKKSA